MPCVSRPIRKQRTFSNGVYPKRFIPGRLDPDESRRFQGSPALSKDTNGDMRSHSCVRNPQGLSAIFGDLQALPVLGFLFPPFFPYLGIPMEFVVLLLQLPQALSRLEDTC